MCWHLLEKYIVMRDFWGVFNKSGKIQQWISCSLRCRGNLTPVSNVCEAAPISLFWAPNGLNELPEVHFQFPFNLIGKSTMAFFNRPIMARAQILVHGWEPRTRILALFRRRA